MSNNDKLSKEHEKIISPTRQIIEKFKYNKLAMVGFISFLLLLLVIVGAQIFIHATNYDLAHVDISKKYMKPSILLFDIENRQICLFLGSISGYQLELP